MGRKIKPRSKEIKGNEIWLPFLCSKCGKDFGANYDIHHIGSRNAVIVCRSCALDD